MENNANQSTPSGIDRRHFLALVAAGLTPTTISRGASAKEQQVDIGQASLYTADGVYDKFRDRGFFLIRKGGKLTALSSYCTHRKCKLAAEPDHTFACKCHGSTFTQEGKVTEGPAKRDLPVFATSTSGNGHLVVGVPVTY
jgi:cytochrome b6-f complex iron-sulfur subunit